MNAPQVSVLLPVHNAAPFLREAIDSLLRQRFADFEIVAVDDGSSDASVEILRCCADPRLRVHALPHRGLVPTLNAGIALCRAPLIARMDADDIAEPERLGVQLEAFAADPALGIVCSDVRLIDAAGRVLGVQGDVDCNAETLRARLTGRVRAKPIIHPSVMLRRSVFERLGGYRDYCHAEDRDLWLRAVGRAKIRRLNEPLLRYRVHPGGVSRAQAVIAGVNAALAVVNHEVERAAGIDLYREQPEVWRAVRDELERALAGRLAAVAALRRGRQVVREGHRLSGAAQMAAVLLRHGPRAMPAATEQAIRAAIERAVASVLAEAGVFGAEALA